MSVTDGQTDILVANAPLRGQNGSGILWLVD